MYYYIEYNNILNTINVIVYSYNISVVVAFIFVQSIYLNVDD